MAVRNVKGFISLPLSSLQIFQATCPKIKSNLSISINKEIKEEVLKNGCDAISFFEKGFNVDLTHQRQCVANGFGYPNLVSPKLMPSWKKLGISQTIYLLHSLAHIEISAVEIAWDTIIRFSPNLYPGQFYLDFLSIASDEARHFNFLCERLQVHNSHYGQIPGHDNLWEIANKTKDDPIARIAAIQLIQEPRALDSGDRLINKFDAYGDKKSAEIMKIICDEEIGHVKIGMDWFTHHCEAQNLAPKPYFQEIVKKYAIMIPPPFNENARNKAGMKKEWYMPVSLNCKS
jgi:uncharacterized ferritin-like protein (DUF455 family)